MTIFQKIIDGEIPCSRLYEDDRCLAFKDIQPQAPFHALVIPKKPVEMIAKADETDEALCGHLLRVAAKVAKDAGYEAFRLVMNNGEAAGQSVMHLHVHVLAGRDMTWPPG